MKGPFIKLKLSCNYLAIYLAQKRKHVSNNNNVLLNFPLLIQRGLRTFECGLLEEPLAGHKIVTMLHSLFHHNALRGSIVHKNMLLQLDRYAVSIVNVSPL